MHGVVGRRPPDRDRLDPGPVAGPRRDRRRVGSRSRPGAGHRRARRWRVRLQGHDAWPRGRRRARGAGRRPAGALRARTAPDARRGGSPDPVDPARPSRRRRRRAAPRHQPRRGRADLTHQGVRRADRGRHPPHVRGTQPPDDPPARPPRRADAGVDARARGVPRHVRPRVGDRRARDGARHRPDRAPDPQRAEGRPRERPSLLQPEPRGLPPGRRRHASGGMGATRPRDASAGGAGGSVPAWRPACTRPAPRRRAPAS